ncbi:hypothetical protein [Rhizobium sp. HT1-10]|uniref:hypothetical protein n=1 Tax=Rhizobium sp. HT1-10 TaxID=3111638 RepID=UPI003C1D0F3C
MSAGTIEPTFAVAIERNIGDALTSTKFVAELVRAANEVDRLGSGESARLLERAIAAIRDLREAVGIPKDGTEHDELIKLRAVALGEREGRRSSNLSSALLCAADMIRTLDIIEDSQTEIDITYGA